MIFCLCHISFKPIMWQVWNQNIIGDDDYLPAPSSSTTEKSSVQFHMPSISGDSPKPKETQLCIEKYMSCKWKPDDQTWTGCMLNQKQNATDWSSLSTLQLSTVVKFISYHFNNTINNDQTNTKTPHHRFTGCVFLVSQLAQALQLTHRSIHAPFALMYSKHAATFWEN